LTRRASRSRARARRTPASSRSRPPRSKGGELKAGDRVDVHLSADEKTALSITPAGDKSTKPVAPGNIGGKVAAVDAATRTITLTTKGGTEVIIKLTADAKVTVDGKETKLAELPKGVFATLALVPTKGGPPREARAVIIAGATFGAVVKEVGASSLTVSHPKIGEKTVKIVSSSKVVINGKEAKASDLKAGDRVDVTLSSDESAAVLITSGKPATDKPKPEKMKPEDK
jgi:hypothetical protein